MSQPATQIASALFVPQTHPRGTRHNQRPQVAHTEPQTPIRYRDLEQAQGRRGNFGSPSSSQMLEDRLETARTNARHAEDQAQAIPSERIARRRARRARRALLAEQEALRQAEDPQSPETVQPARDSEQQARNRAQRSRDTDTTVQEGQPEQRSRNRAPHDLNQTQRDAIELQRLRQMFRELYLAPQVEAQAGSSARTQSRAHPRTQPRTAQRTPAQAQAQAPTQVRPQSQNRHRNVAPQIPNIAQSTDTRQVRARAHPAASPTSEVHVTTSCDITHPPSGPGNPIVRERARYEVTYTFR